MKNYIADFNTKERCGSQIASADTIDDLINTMQDRGCNIHKGYIEKMQKWEIKANDGEKFYGNRFTIVKGKNRMTNYTSF